MPKFDEDEFNANFDEEVQPIVIPDEVVDDIDNDWEVVVEAEE